MWRISSRSNYLETNNDDQNKNNPFTSTDEKAAQNILGDSQKEIQDEKNQDGNEPLDISPKQKEQEKGLEDKPILVPQTTINPVPPVQPQMLGGGSKPPKKRNWGKIIMWSLLITLIVLLFWGIFAPPSAYLISQQEFINFWNNGSWGTLNVAETGATITIYETYTQLTIYITAGGESLTPYVIYFDNSEQAYAFLESLGQYGTQTEVTGFPMINVYSDVYTGPGWFGTFILTWLPWILFMVLGMLIVKKIVDKKQGQGMQKKLLPQLSNIKFSDISGYDEVKTEMMEIVDFLRNPYKYSQVGVRTPKGVLLTGAPGTGKTLWAKAVAGEAGVPFYSLSGSDFVEMYVGVGASRVRSLFEAAKVAGASIIFIDEIDAVGRQRGSGVGGGNDEREQTLNQLLVEMDGFSGNTGVIVMAATNRPDVLDPALKRPGRFDREILIRLPDVKEREAILRNYASRGNKKLAPSLDFTNIATRTPGFSGAELENVINEAAILGIRENAKEITVDIVDEAIDRVMGGPSKTNNIITMEEKKQIAYHEAGHAIIGLVKEHAQLVQKISIIPRGQAGGYVLMTPKKEKMIQTKSELMAKITSYLGGRASEEFFFGDDNVSTGASSDIQEATHIARKMVTEWGMSPLGPIQFEERQGSVFLGRELGREKSFSPEKAKEIDAAIKQIIDVAHVDAKKIIKENEFLMHLFAEALILKETLNSEEIAYIYKNKKLTEELIATKEKRKNPPKENESKTDSVSEEKNHSTTSKEQSEQKSQFDNSSSDEQK